MKTLILNSSIFLGLFLFAGCSQNNNFSKTFDPKKLYKIVPAANYDATNDQDAVKLMKLDTESGFIHMSHGDQVEKILRKFFTNMSDILVLEIDLNILEKNGLVLKVEQNNTGGTYYPHLYGKQQIPSKAVVNIIKVKEQPDKSWIIVK